MADRDRRNVMFAHQEWLGFVQPVGLVVSPNVMADAQVVPDRNVSGRQREFRELLEEDGRGVAARWRAPDVRRVLVDWLGWEPGDLQDAAEHRDALEVALPELQTVLSPTWAVPEDDVGEPDPPEVRETRAHYDAGARSGRQEAGWSMLVSVEDGADLDSAPEAATWNATRHARFERLLRETRVPVGLLCTDECVRLVYAPEGESSGHLTFDFSQMALPAGRPILSAFEMLLSAEMLFGGAAEARLGTLLAKSRQAQAEVSTRLSRQVLAALHELLRGFVAAEARGAGFVADLARRDPEHLYGGLITTLMRLVFVLYAEDRGLMPDHPVYQQHYSLSGLFGRLRADAAAWPDTMDQRFGAWAQLLALFRLIHGGGGHGGLSFVARKGALLDPDRFPFLEGRGPDSEPSMPMVPDATVWKVLRSLMVLDGERLSYRTLDVEQIGSVYEAVMGFRVELTTGRSIALASQKRTGAAVVVDLDGLLALEAGKRAKALQDAIDRRLTGTVTTALRAASDVADVVAALERVVDRDATPEIVPAGTPVLQPTDERRRSGSHYTPRSLTEPIVSEALRPILERLGRDARPEDILDLKVLDPATGSGAFLVEVCRQLSARLVEAWAMHGGPTELPPDEDELLHARRLVAQRCLYGVDKNPMAIDLARLSLWLITLARDHEFTFVDHALRPGDSLVGLTRRQIEGFHWDAERPKFQAGTEMLEVGRRTARVAEMRQLIRELGDDAPESELRELLEEVDRETRDVHGVGGLLLAAFFEGGKSKDRENRRVMYSSLLLGEDRAAIDAVVAEKLPVAPLHWELEFPEVFERENPGFDAVVGNPPFAGRETLREANVTGYADWLSNLHPRCHGQVDLVAHFFRRAFELLRDYGTLGLIATNTIAQGDTRAAGLGFICEHGGEVYSARRRVRWPGLAAVIVSIVHVHRGIWSGLRSLDGAAVSKITAFLFHRGGHGDPSRLADNKAKSYFGSKLLGMGFTFDDTDKNGVATPLAEMKRLVTADPRNQQVIRPYIGGAEINANPTHRHHRYAIDFRDFPLRRCEQGARDALWAAAKPAQRLEWLRHGVVPHDYSEPVAEDWPDLLGIVQQKVKPERDNLKASWGKRPAMLWWQHVQPGKELQAAMAGLDRVLATSRIGQHAGFTFLPANMVYADSLIIFPLPTHAAFCALQSRPHEIWARFFGSSMKDDLRYTPSDCFETFPFPEGWETRPALEAAGKAYYDFRAALMTENDEGMTKTYNRFHDPEERDARIFELRELHAAMDRAVLEAYDWNDIPADCEFVLDYEIDEETWGRKRKPWRYRWPNPVRDEVLARLLALNAERAAEERLAGRNANLKTRIPGVPS